MAAFALSGLVYAVSLTGGGAGAGPAHEVTTRTPALDPRPDPAGRRLAYVCDGALRVASLAGGPRGPGRRRPAGRAGGDVRAARVHRGRGDGPPSWLLVGSGRLRPARRAGRRDPRHPVAHRRSRAPGTHARRGGLPCGRHPERRRVPAPGPARRHHRAGRDRPGRLPLPGDGPLAGRARPAGRGAEPGPAHHADPRRAGQHRPGQRAARGHRPALAGDRPGRPGLDRGRPDRVDPGRAGHPPPGPRGARPGARAGHPAGPAGPRRAGRGRRHRAVPGVPGAGRGRAVELRAGGPAPGRPGRGQPGRSQPGRGRPGRRRRSGHPRGRHHGHLAPGPGHRRRDRPRDPRRRPGQRSTLASRRSPNARRCPRPARSCSGPARARSRPRSCSRPGISPGRAGCRCCSTRTAARTRSGWSRPAAPTWSRSGSPSRGSRW